MAIGIRGISEENFNDLFEGDEELFISVLRSFVNKTPSTLCILATVTPETLPDYAIRIHGLKGACAGICAEEARQMAYKLEMMSKAGDLPGVQANNGAFLEYMKELMGNLQNWLKNHP